MDWQHKLSLRWELSFLLPPLPRPKLDDGDEEYPKTAQRLGNAGAEHLHGPHILFIIYGV